MLYIQIVYMDLSLAMELILEFEMDALEDMIIGVLIKVHIILIMKT